MKSGMVKPFKHFYEFGPFRLDVVERTLTRDGKLVPITPKSFEILLVLVQNNGHLVEKDKLMQMVWPDTFVEEDNLTQNISKLRKVLDGEGQHLIETVPRRGYRFVGSVRETLEELPASPQSSSAAHKLPSGSTSSVGPGKRWLAGTALALILALAAALVWRPTARPDHPFAGLQQVRITFEAGLETDPALSPEATRIAYISDQSGYPELYWRPLGGGHPVALTSDRLPKSDVKWSPDGSSLVFSRGLKNGIYLVSASGGPARKLTDFGVSPSFSSDGQKIVFATSYRPSLTRTEWHGQHERSIWVLQLDTGALEEIIGKQHGFEYLDGVTWSPDGKLISFCGRQKTDEKFSSSLFNYNLKDRQLARLFSADWVSKPCWKPDGSGILFSSNHTGTLHIWGLPVDSEGRKAGPPFQVTSGATDDTSVSISADGKTLAYAATQTMHNLRLFQIQRAGAPRATHPVWLTSSNSPKAAPRLAPNGEQVAFQSVTNGNLDLWIVDVQTTNTYRITDNPDIDRAPAWAPDGNWIFFASVRAGAYGIWKVPSSGGVPVVIKSTPNSRPSNLSCSPEGKTIVFNDSTEQKDSAYLISTQDGEEELLSPPGQTWRNPLWSPDGREITYQVGESSIWIYTVATGESRSVGFSPPAHYRHPETHVDILSWSKSGRELYGVLHEESRGEYIAVLEHDLAAGVTRPVLEVKDEEKDRIIGRKGDCDGSQLVLVMGRQAGDIWLLKPPDRP